MGMTLAQKILARASGKKAVEPGEIVKAKADWVVMPDLSGGRLFKTVKKLNCRIREPEKVVVVFDHKVPAENAWSAALHQRWRQFCEEQGITHLHDIGNHGISHTLAVERGYARPGVLLLNHDTHANTCGAMGCFATAVGDDLLLDLLLGWGWYRIPHTIRVHLLGTMRPGVMPRDVAQHIAGDVGSSGARDMAMEFVGSAVDAMSIDGRMVVCNWSRKCEAVTGLMNPDDKTISFAQRAAGTNFEPLYSDPDAYYAKERYYNVDEVEPLVAAPPDPTNTRPISEVAGRQIDQAFVGSCAGGTLDDLRTAAVVLRGQKVHPRVRLIVTPATNDIFRAATREGLLGDLVEAGAVVTPSTCGTCYGGLNGILADGEVCIASSTENHPGRMGSYSAHIYLASPATVAASAVAGVITDPRELLKGPR